MPAMSSKTGMIYRFQCNVVSNIVLKECSCDKIRLYKGVEQLSIDLPKLWCSIVCNIQIHGGIVIYAIDYIMDTDI